MMLGQMEFINLVAGFSRDKSKTKYDEKGKCYEKLSIVQPPGISADNFRLL